MSSSATRTAPAARAPSRPSASRLRFCSTSAASRSNGAAYSRSAATRRWKQSARATASARRLLPPRDVVARRMTSADANSDGSRVDSRPIDTTCAASGRFSSGGSRVDDASVPPRAASRGVVATFLNTDASSRKISSRNANGDVALGASASSEASSRTPSAGSASETSPCARCRSAYARNLSPSASAAPAISPRRATNGPCRSMRRTHCTTRSTLPGLAAPGAPGGRRYARDKSRPCTSAQNVSVDARSSPAVALAVARSIANASSRRPSSSASSAVCDSGATRSKRASASRSDDIANSHQVDAPPRPSVAATHPRCSLWSGPC